ncbi:MAG TPA: GNAT family N-acetyltransferase, partial [Polyangiaceae bacterium]|nr:GNAT family N-acetyltransferase [Polyangiaceae bacterium]
RIVMQVVLQCVHADDVGFAYEVTEAAMRVYVEQTWGTWDVTLQLESNAKSFDASTHQLVLVDGERAGIVAVAVHESHVQLEKLYLLPSFQNLGVGSEVVRRLFELPTLKGKPVRLRVLEVDAGAQRFYLRFGFVVTGVNPPRVFMEARPA